MWARLRLSAAHQQFRAVSGSLHERFGHTLVWRIGRPALRVARVGSAAVRRGHIFQQRGSWQRVAVHRLSSRLVVCDWLDGSRAVRSRSSFVSGAVDIAWAREGGRKEGSHKKKVKKEVGDC